MDEKNCIICGDAFQPRMKTQRLCRKESCKKEYQRKMASGELSSQRRKTASKKSVKKEAISHNGVDIDFGSLKEDKTECETTDSRMVELTLLDGRVDYQITLTWITK